jgi:hypothetical protein
VFICSLLELWVKANRDEDFNVVLKTSDHIANTTNYEADKVMGLTDKDRRVLYLVKWKVGPAKDHYTRQPLDSYYSVGAKEKLRVFHLTNPDALRDSHLTNSE